MTITQLKYVLAVAKYQNFTLAASHCFVTQPTLSMQIQKLEETLDTQLFVRNKKPIQLTDIGKKIAEQARIVVEESNRINDIIDQQKGFIGGDFKVGIIPTVMPTLLPLFIKGFLRKYPEVNLIIEELTTEEILKKLNEGQLDVAIAATPLNEESIKERVLYYEPFVGFVPEQHRLFDTEKIAVEDLDIQDIILLKDGHCFKDSVLNLCNTFEKDIDNRLQLFSGSFDTIIKLSKEGLGMTLLPYLHSLDLEDKDRMYLREFSGTAPAREVSLIFHKSQLKMHLIEALKVSIDRIVKTVIVFNDVNIISPVLKKEV